MLTVLALCIALLAFVEAPVPMDAKGNPDLPSPAFEQVGLYRLEIALLVFYGDLLLITPALSGLIRGRLPTEISTRGAKFAEETDQSTEAAKAAIEKLEQATDSLGEGLTAAHIEIKRLKERSCRDDKQPRVDSNHD
jgi:hypothetical protein